MADQQVGILIEKIARSLQSAIWILQNTMDDLQRLGLAIADLNKGREKGNVKEKRGKQP